jgi:hypothetical protein
MRSALDSRDLCHLLFLVLNGIGRSGLCQLTQISQGRNLCCICGGDRFVIVVIVGLSSEHILLKWLGWRIPVMACCGSSGIEATLKRSLDKHSQHNPCLLHIGEAVTLL